MNFSWLSSRNFRTGLLYIFILFCICLKFQSKSCKQCISSTPESRVYDIFLATNRRQLEVDFVYTYVNGSDPNLFRAINSNFKDVSDNRFRDYDTLKYSFRSIVKYAPWFRNLYLIVANNDSQVPSWIDRSNTRIRIITHEQIFVDREDHLPTFNSHAIEAHMWRIPDLSEYFVYFNDDVLLGSHVSKSDFFNEKTGQIVTYPQASISPENIFAQRNVYRNTFNLLDYMGLKIPERGLNIYSESHTPHALKKHLMERVWRTWPLDMEYTSRHRERLGSDISIFVLLYNWARIDPHVWGIQLKENSYMYILLENRYLHQFLRHDLYRWKFLTPKFICINDKIFHLNDYRMKTLDILKDFLASYYPEPSEFEVFENYYSYSSS